MKDNPINIELRDKVFAMRDQFSVILDYHGESMDGALRVKMAKAELVLNRVAILMDQQLTD